ncbi:hypothetical protein ACE83Q_03510 [Dellaglioa sp. P0083]|uniref:hypothetical protein n=1 Tax=Dellaglioa kimchii TaxID=3344667 RepID=UPI0038D4FEC8
MQIQQIIGLIIAILITFFFPSRQWLERHHLNYFMLVTYVIILIIMVVAMPYRKSTGLNEIYIVSAFIIYELGYLFIYKRLKK